MPQVLQRPMELGRGRVIAGFVLALVMAPLLEFLLDRVVHTHFATDVLVHLAATVAVAIVGGLWPALFSAVYGTLILNFFSTEPMGSFDIRDPENVIALLVFIAVAVAVSLVVGAAARQTREANAARAEARTLSTLARGVLASRDTVPDFLAQVRGHFGADGISLFAPVQAAGNGAAGWARMESSGEKAPRTLEEADTVEYIADQLAVGLCGRPLNANEQRLLTAFGSNLLAVRQRQQLAATRKDNERLEEGNLMRTSILRAVSHDLRTPLSGIKLSVNSLRAPGTQLSGEDRAELLATIEASADRLDALVGNLLDMSRITADAVNPLLRPLRWVDAVTDALHELDASRFRVQLPPNLPQVDADAGMLERVIVNIAENALKYAGRDAGADIVITGAVGGAGSSTVNGVPASELRIVDHGRGIPAGEAARIFQPFQRLDDAPAGAGVGLGLAVAKGLTEAMGGALAAEPTPGGGLTLVIKLPISTGFTGKAA